MGAWKTALLLRQLRTAGLHLHLRQRSKVHDSCTDDCTKYTHVDDEDALTSSVAQELAQAAD